MMRGSSAILVPVMCLLLGLGAGYVLFGGDGTSPDDGTADLTGDALTNAGDGQAPEPLRAATLEVSGRTDPLSAVLQAVPVPEVQVGEGVISGRVTDQMGEPVPGARMTLTAQPDPGSYVKPDPKDDPDVTFLKQMRQMIKLHRWGSAFRQVTTTDTDGAYRFERVTKRLHRVEAVREGYQIHPRDHSAWRGVFPGATVDFTARAMARLRIEVTGSAAPTSLLVELRTGTGSSIGGMQWSPSEPVINCQPGTWDVHVTGGDQQELRGGPYPVVLEAGKEPVTVRVELEARPVLRLHVKFAPDEVMPLFTYIMPTPSSGMPTAAVLRTAGKSDMRQWMYSSMLSATAKEHVQTFTDLQEGRHTVGIARERGGSIVNMEEVVVRGGIVDHTLEVPPLDPDSYVIVAAYGPDGELVKNPRFSTGYRSDSGSSSGGSQTAQRRDGRTLVMHNSRGEAADASGTWWVDVTAAGLGSRRLEYVRGQTRALRVDFQEPAEVSVAVKGVQGTPYEGRVSVTMHPGASKQRSGIGSGLKPDEKGRFLVRGLQPDEYVLTLHVTTGQHRRSTTVAEMPYVVKSGSQQTSIALPPLFTLTVRGATRHVSLSNTGRGGVRVHQSQTADEEGVAVFDALPAGTYQVRSGRGRADVTLPGPSAITLEERKRGR